MRGKNTDGVQYILEMGDRKEAYALYLFLTFGEYTRADRNEVDVSGSREVMDLWRQYSKSMDRTAAEDRLHSIHGQLQSLFIFSGCGPSPALSEVSMFFSVLSRWTGTFSLPLQWSPTLFDLLSLIDFCYPVAIDSHGCIFYCFFEC